VEGGEVEKFHSPEGVCFFRWKLVGIATVFVCNTVATGYCNSIRRVLQQYLNTVAAGYYNSIRTRVCIQKYALFFAPHTVDTSLSTSCSSTSAPSTSCRSTSAYASTTLRSSQLTCARLFAFSKEFLKGVDRREKLFINSTSVETIFKQSSSHRYWANSIISLHVKHK